MEIQELKKTANSLVADNKGILTINESNGTCNKRIAAAGITQTGDFRHS